VTLQFDWTFREASYNNEIGYFVVDDDAGRVGGIAPGEAGYAQAALSSTARRLLFASGQKAGPGVDLTLAGGTRLMFYIIQNNTTSNWLATNPQNSSAGSIALFSVTAANPDGFDHVRSQDTTYGGVQLNWEDQSGGGDRDFNDVVFSVGPAALLVPGTAGQTSQGLFDWVSKDAKFNNELGVYRVDDATGRIGNLLPGDAGYAAAALGNGNSSVVFARGQTAGAQASVSLASGSYVAWYMIQNGTTAQFLSQNLGNQLPGSPLALFSLATASADGIDHLWRRLGGEFAFEDQTNDGDDDFNDLVFRFRFSA
jgi:hypothetical protein